MASDPIAKNRRSANTDALASSSLESHHRFIAFASKLPPRHEDEQHFTVALASVLSIRIDTNTHLRNAGYNRRLLI